MRQHNLALYVFLILLTPMAAQETNPSIAGIWSSSTGIAEEADVWNACWIWLGDDHDSDVMLARRSFFLSSIPDSSLLRITASSQYQLYLNGSYCCRGPARCAAHHQSYDILDLKNQLRLGKNTIAVRVHHQDGRHSYHHRGRPGLLVQLDLWSDQQRTSIGTDQDWKVSRDPSWNDASPYINRFQLVVSDRVDMQQYIRDWETIEFFDAKWDQASALLRDVGWPGPQPNAAAQTLIPPWTRLVPRDIPYLAENEVYPLNLIIANKKILRNTVNSVLIHDPVPITSRMDKIPLSPFLNHRETGDPLTIPSSEEGEIQFLLFDFGKVINGAPMLEAEGMAGTAMEIMYAPFMVDSTFDYQVVDSEFRDRVILSGRRDFWEATYTKPTRYLGLAYRTDDQPLRIYNLSIRQIAYPFHWQGHISSTDADWVEQYMDATRKTIEVCTTDGYMDNYRERRQYAQTGYYASLGNYWIFGDFALQRRYLIQTAQEQEANGIMPAYAPLAKDDFMIILDSNCLWIRSLRNYFLYSGDIASTVQLLPAARKLMDLLHSFTNELGLINEPPYAYWLDHAPIDRRGANFLLNGHYLGALEDFAETLAWLDQEDHPLYASRADLLRQSLQLHLWDEQKQLFADAWIDGVRSDQFSEHANAMALSLNLASEHQADLIVRQILRDDAHDFITRENGMTVVTPAMSYFLHKGLSNYDYVDESFELLRKRFDKMLDPSTNGTLWEEWWLDHTGRSGKKQKKSRSDAQTESAFAPALFGEFLLGIRVTEPGWREIEISHPSTVLRHIKGSIPTPLGMLHLEWSLSADNVVLTIDAPTAMVINVKGSRFDLTTHDQLSVEGHVIRPTGSQDGTIKLQGGQHRLLF